MYIKVASKDDAVKLSDLLKDGDWMVLYYAEWCGHCNEMKPEWKKVVEKMGKSKTVNVADVESAHIGELADKPQVEGFPTIKMYNNGKEVANFKDDRVADKMEKFALSNSRVRKTSKKAAEPSPPSAIRVNDVANSLIKINDELDGPVKHQPEVISEPAQETINLFDNMMNNKKMNNKMMNNKMMNNKMMNNIKINNKPAETYKLPSIFKKSTRKSPKKTTKKPSLPKAPKPFPPASDLPCDKIMKAKICKSNPKCMFDYTNYKCKYKPAENNSGEAKKFNLGMTNNIAGKKKSKKTMKPMKTRKTSSKKSGKKANSVKRTASNVFEQLIKSFKRIGNEAEKDSLLLKKATKKL